MLKSKPSATASATAQKVTFGRPLEPAAANLSLAPCSIPIQNRVFGARQIFIGTHLWLSGAIARVSASSGSKVEEPFSRSQQWSS